MTRLDEILRRLSSDRPDLAAKVRAGSMTPHDALILAGSGPGKAHKARTAAGPAPCPPEPEAAAEWLLGRFRGGRLEALIEALRSGAKDSSPDGK